MELFQNRSRPVGRGVLFCSHLFLAVFTAAGLGLPYFFRQQVDPGCATLLTLAGAAALSLVACLLLGEAGDGGRGRSRFKETAADEAGCADRVELERRVAERTLELMEVNERLRAEIAERRRIEAELVRAAGVDPLTGLLNRRAVSEELKRLAAQTRRTGRPFAILLCDLDHFKGVNDAYGHDMGDEALRLTARRLREAVREQDLASRWGGEEFLLALPDTDLAGGLILAEKIRRRLAGRVFGTNGDAVHLTVSVGVGVHRADRSVDASVKAADEALYRAKRAGRNRVVAENEP